jgi:biofilm PGA synthesis N-glycosyltransferase PgaC
VGRYAAANPWIEFLRMPERKERNFAGKVLAFNAGYARMQGLPYGAIASVDADISFDPDYFSFLLGKMEEDSRLGLVGTPFQDGPNPIYDYRFVNIEHVSGACQLFRRQCFEAIGGYTPVKGGGIDYLAVLTARMKGWKTRTFTEKICLHHREMGTAQHGILKARFKNGIKDYAFGNHPLWELSRTLYQATKKPWVIGGLMLISGYVWAFLRGVDRPVSRELVAFSRQEQLHRLGKFFGRRSSAPQSHLTAPVAK